MYTARLPCRFKSAKQFIRHEADQAMVQVTMWNTGPDAYRPELLGRELTVERRINRAGGGGFCIKNAKGLPVSQGAASPGIGLDQRGAS